MIVYEVNLFVNSKVAVGYGKWLNQHIEEMLRLPGFVKAQLMTREEPNKKVFTALYYLNSKNDLDSYFENHAERMREQATELFANQFTATRNIYDQILNFETNRS